VPNPNTGVRPRLQRHAAQRGGSIGVEAEGNGSRLDECRLSSIAVTVRSAPIIRDTLETD
jgi:hypothetical protein